MKKYFVEAVCTTKGLNKVKTFTFEAKDEEEAIGFAEARLSRMYPLFTWNYKAGKLVKTEVEA